MLLKEGLFPSPCDDIVSFHLTVAPEHMLHAPMEKHAGERVV